MTDEPHNAAETEPAGKLPTIVAVHATGPISLRITWSDGIEGELNLTTVLADRRFAALRDPAEFARVGVGEWGDRTRVVEGQGVAVRGDRGGGRICQKTNRATQ